MASNGTFNMRIQLKADTEANWIAHPIIPLANELIIYTSDDTHVYARLKVGDGTTNVNALPFIDAGTLNGTEVEFVKVATYEDLPSIGSEDKLYLVLDTSKVYHYISSSGYSLLSGSYNTEKKTIGGVVAWLPGTRTTATLEHGILKITSGVVPELLWSRESVVSNIIKEGS